MRRPLLVLVCVAGLHSAAAAAGPVEVKVDGVVLDPDSGSPVVRLVEKAKAHRELPIWIGPFEAQAIALEMRSEEHTSELQSHSDLVCRLLLEKKKIHEALHLSES